MANEDKRPEWLNDLYRQAERISPGIYRLPDGRAIVNLAELLKMIGEEDTPENRAEILAIVQAELRNIVPETQQVVCTRHTKDPDAGGPPPAPPGI